MKKSVISNSILFLSSLLLMIVSLWFSILVIFLLFTILLSFLSSSDLSNKKWLLGFILLNDSKKVHSDYGDNFWTVITMDVNEDYYAYLLKDKLFHCITIGDRIRYNGNIEELKSRIDSRLDSYCGDIKHKREYHRRVDSSFKDWDGCLTKEDSRDKKIRDIC